MIKLTFLSSGLPLTKTINTDGSKSTYPNVKNFSSLDIEIKSIQEFHKHLSTLAASPSRPCLLKGNLTKQLKNEPRKGETKPNTPTQWVCLDVDGGPFSTPDEFMRAIDLPHVSYIMQYSSSYGLNKSKTLNCHIFALLSKPVAPQDIKAWLMHLNLHTTVLERALRLSDQQNHLKWSLDITTCQNDKLLYVAAPIFANPKMDPLPGNRIQLVMRPEASIDVTKLALSPIAKLRKEASDKRDELRRAAGLNINRSKLQIKDGMSILPGADETPYTIVDEDDEFIRLNLGKGDSAAYYILKSHPELIRNFKGEDYVYTKDACPDLFKHLTNQFHDANFTPSSGGDQVLAFREKRTGKYWKGLYNAAPAALDIHEVDSKDKLHDFLLGHGLQPPPYIPEWQLVFDPSQATIIDNDQHIVNFYVPPHIERAKGSYPIIQQALDSAVGTGPIQEHFLNWLAVILQHKTKTETAWVLHGTQGTGKGILINRVIRKLIGMQYSEHILATALSSDFDGWQENKLLVFIDEIEVDMFEKKSGVESKLKKMITEDTDDVHRKGVTRYSVRSFVNLIFGSNKPHMIVIPGDDRRYNIGAFQDTRWNPSEHEIERLMPKELPAFAEYMMTRKACKSTARQVLHTTDRAAVQALSMSSADELADDILKGDIEKLVGYLPDEDFLNQHGLMTQVAQSYTQLIKTIVIERQSNISRDQLQIIFQHCIGKVADSPHRFTSYLRHRGITLKNTKLKGIDVKGVTIQWNITEELEKQMIKRFRPTPALRKIK
jgi:hypothetical protein